MSKDAADMPAEDPAGSAEGPQGPEAPVVDPKAKPAAQPDYYDQLLRLKAEFENYRKRVDRDRPEWIAMGKAGLLDRLLPLYDLLLQAHEQVLRAPAGEIAKGLELIFKEFTRLFEAEGVAPIESVGKAYDHELHEVLGFVETSAKPDGVVVEELQRGYLFKGKVLRPARVRIAKTPQPKETSA